MAEMYTPPNTIYGKTDDGRDYIIARGGKPIPMTKAKELGLVKEPKQAKPTETKKKK